MNKIKLGVIGTGLIWEYVHSPILKKMSDRFEITALCIRRLENVDRWKKEYPGAQIYADYHDLLKDGNVEAVLVAPPIRLNGSITIDALEAGKDVFEEKPIGLSYSEAKAILDTRDRTGKKVFPLEQVAYAPSVDFVRMTIEEGRLGKLVSFEKTGHSLDIPPEDGSGFLGTEWRQNPDYPLGALFDGGAHDMAVLYKMFGMPERIFASGSRLRPVLGDYDHVFTLFQYAGGSSGVFSHSSLLEPSHNGERVCFEKGTVTISGGRVEIAGNDGSVTKEELEEVNQYEFMWSRLYEAYRTGEGCAFTAEDGAEVMKVYDALSLSLREKRSVVL